MYALYGTRAALTSRRLSVKLEDHGGLCDGDDLKLSAYDDCKLFAYATEAEAADVAELPGIRVELVQTSAQWREQMKALAPVIKCNLRADGYLAILADAGACRVSADCDQIIDTPYEADDVLNLDRGITDRVSAARAREFVARMKSETSCPIGTNPRTSPSCVRGRCQPIRTAPETP
jgi:hypothetical protein